MSDPLLPPVVQTPVVRPPFDMPSSNEAASTAPVDTDTKTEPEGVLSNRPLILGILFGVTGVLGLPLLWYSPVFTRKEKWLWTLINTLYTLGLLAIAIAALQVIWNAVEQM